MIFTKWDEFASLHKVFKVETINEIYMVAGGLPYPKIEDTDYSHPIRMVFFANDIMNYCHEVLEVLVPQSECNVVDSDSDDDGQYKAPKLAQSRQHRAETTPLSVPKTGKVELIKKNSGRGMGFNYGTRYNPHSKNQSGARNSLLPSTFKTAFKKKQNTITLNIRIGMNIGYVVAGVIG
eukprot:356151_1